MRETDQSLFKPNEHKKARLEMFGITTRVATIKANINLTKEAEIEVRKTIRTLQTDYSQKSLKKCLRGTNRYKSLKSALRANPNGLLL